jgi:hypothetical protein
MASARSLATGLALGSGLAFFFDGISGRRRRALVRDQFTHAGKVGRRFFVTGAKDLEHRAAGRLHELRARIAAVEVPDKVLVQRVRARAGRLVRHPRELHVDAEKGLVRLRGVVAPFERAAVVDAVRSTPGVARVEDHLELGHPDERPPAPHPRWTPAKRLAGALGALSLATIAWSSLRSV